MRAIISVILLVISFYVYAAPPWIAPDTQMLARIYSGRIGYNRVATPFRAEEQRAANAGFIMTVTAGAFSVVALLTGVAVYLLIRHRRL